MRCRPYTSSKFSSGSPYQLKFPSVSAVGPHEATWYDLWLDWLGLSGSPLSIGPSLFFIGSVANGPISSGQFITPTGR